MEISLRWKDKMMFEGKLSELLFAWLSIACVHSWYKVSCKAEIWMVCSIMMKTMCQCWSRLWQAEQQNPVYMKTAQAFARLEEQTELSFLCLFSFSPTAMWKKLVEQWGVMIIIQTSIFDEWCQLRLFSPSWIF